MFYTSKNNNITVSDSRTKKIGKQGTCRMIAPYRLLVCREDVVAFCFQDKAVWAWSMSLFILLLRVSLFTDP